MDFSQRLKLLRDEKGITQDELAKGMGVGRPTIAGYETKGKQPSFDTLKKLADFFNVSVDYLLGRTDIRTPITTVAMHRTDGYEDDLPEEAKKELDSFKEYIRQKYKK